MSGKAYYYPLLQINSAKEIKEFDLVENDFYFATPITTKKRTNLKLLNIQPLNQRREFIFFLLLQQMIQRLKRSRLKKNWQSITKECKKKSEYKTNMLAKKRKEFCKNS